MGAIVDASIIILTKNAGENFGQLLERIFSQQFDGQFEVLIIDSGSIDSTLKITRDFPVRITEIKPNEFHHGKTRNLGAELSSGKILVYITQDALPLNNNWLEKLTNNLKDTKVAMVVGRQIPWQSTKPPEKFYYVYYFPEHRIVVTYGASDYYRDNVFISNVNSAIRKDVWQRFKFSETIIAAEDKEFAKRVLAGGWNIVYEPEAAAYHAHDFSLWSAFQRSLDYGIALRQGAGGLPKSPKSITRRVFEYLGSELQYLNASRYMKWLPYCIMYEMSTYLGRLLGKTGLMRRNWGQR